MSRKLWGVDPYGPPAFWRVPDLRRFGYVSIHVQTRRGRREPLTSVGHPRGHERVQPRCGGLRADLAEHPLTKGVMSSDQALLGLKAAIDAALGRGSQALTEWIAGFK